MGACRPQFPPTAQQVAVELQHHFEEDHFLSFHTNFEFEKLVFILQTCKIMASFAEALDAATSGVLAAVDAGDVACLEELALRGTSWDMKAKRSRSG